MVLRPELYRRLVQRFTHVAVADAGVPMSSVIERRAIDNKKHLRLVTPGEYYRISCPYCNDTRQRLWINHMWAYRNADTGSNNLWLCVCYNEACLKTCERQRDLYNKVFDDTWPYDPQKDIVIKGMAPPAPSAPSTAELPGTVQPLDHLPPDHRACDYLRARGYDPIRLSRALGYCVQNLPRYPSARDRIIIPIYMRGELVGWQGRLCYDTDNKYVAKYYSQPGMRKSAMLYNFDNAKKYPFVVVCEGPTDVWSFGPEAVALFGKTASAAQRLLISSQWKSGIVILLDADAAEDATCLAAELQGNSPVVVIRLPAEKDPGNFPSHELRQMVAAQALQQGLDLQSLGLKLCDAVGGKRVADAGSVDATAACPPAAPRAEPQGANL